MSGVGIPIGAENIAYRIDSFQACLSAWFHNRDSTLVKFEDIVPERNCSDDLTVGGTPQDRYYGLTNRLVALRLYRPAVSFSCLSNNRVMGQCRRCRVSGATGANDYGPTLHEWNKNLQSNYKTTEYTTRHKSRYQ